MNIKKEIFIKESQANVWEVLGNQFADAYKWASGLNHSHGYGTPKLLGTTCNFRSCDTTQGKIKEVIKLFDPDKYILQYEVIEGFPFFVKQGINTWSLSKKGSGTLVSMDLVIQTKGLFGIIMGPMMKMQMNKITDNVLDDLKQFIETGQPSERKVKEINKYKNKAA